MAVVLDLSTRYLNVDDILYLHHEVISSSGDSGGILSHGNLEYCIQTATDISKDPPSHKMMAFVASYYIWCLVNNHPFLDGNKRTAYQIAYVFLLANGYLLTQMKPQDVVTTLNSIAMGKISREELTQWIEQHLSQLNSL